VKRVDIFALFLYHDRVDIEMLILNICTILFYQLHMSSINSVEILLSFYILYTIIYNILYRKQKFKFNVYYRIEG